MTIEKQYIYWHQQKNGVMFTWASDLEPEAELADCLNMGAGLSALYVKTHEGWDKVYDIGLPSTNGKKDLT